MTSPDDVTRTAAADPVAPEVSWPLLSQHPEPEIVSLPVQREHSATRAKSFPGWRGTKEQLQQIHDLAQATLGPADAATGLVAEVGLDRGVAIEGELDALLASLSAARIYSVTIRNRTPDGLRQIAISFKRSDQLGQGEVTLQVTGPREWANQTFATLRQAMDSGAAPGAARRVPGGMMVAVICIGLLGLLIAMSPDTDLVGTGLLLIAAAVYGVAITFAPKELSGEFELLPSDQEELS